MATNLTSSRFAVASSLLVWLSALIVLSGFSLIGCSSPPLGDNPQAILQSGRLPADQQQVLELLLDQTASPADRRVAARSLLDDPSWTSEQVVAAVLEDRSDPEATRAVVSAISTHPRSPSPELANPMLELLQRSMDPVQGEVAEALGRFNDPDVVERLGAMANSPNGSTRVRRGAIDALGYQRTQQAAGELMTLIGPDQPGAVQRSAYESLQRLSGQVTFGEDRAAWTRWWSVAQDLKEPQWRSQLIDTLTMRHATQRVRQQETELRLLELSRASYRSASDEDKPRVLAFMLSESLPTVRKLAIDLATERLVDGLPFDEQLRAALRGRLEDPEAVIRKDAVLLLLQLPDEQAADIVARRLAANQEHVTEVLRANLLMMARMPRAAAAEAALRLLDTASLQAEAAGALAAMAKANMLTEKQSREAARLVSERLSRNATPPAQFVTLLAAVGDDDDWQRIAGWVDSDQRSIKQAAAQAWADSNRSLELLAKRMDDPVIVPIVIAAATQRGMDPWTLLELAENPPDNSQVREAWDKALVAMSGRVPSETVLEVVNSLQARSDTTVLIDQMATAALTRPQTPAMPVEVRTGLLLARAESSLAQSDPTAAISDLQEVLSSRNSLTAVNRDRLDRGRVRAYIALNQIDESFAAAADLLGQSPNGGTRRPTDDPVIGQLIELGKFNADRERITDANRVVTQLRVLLGPSMKPEVAQRIRLLESDIRAMAPGTRTPPANSNEATAGPADPPRIP